MVSPITIYLPYDHDSEEMPELFRMLLDEERKSRVKHHFDTAEKTTG